MSKISAGVEKDKDMPSKDESRIAWIMMDILNLGGLLLINNNLLNQVTNQAGRDILIPPGGVSSWLIAGDVEFLNDHRLSSSRLGSEMVHNPLCTQSGFIASLTPGIWVRLHEG